MFLKGHKSTIYIQKLEYLQHLKRFETFDQQLYNLCQLLSRIYNTWWLEISSTIYKFCAILSKAVWVRCRELSVHYFFSSHSLLYLFIIWSPELLSTWVTFLPGGIVLGFWKFAWGFNSHKQKLCEEEKNGGHCGHLPWTKINQLYPIQIHSKVLAATAINHSIV